jgi:peptidylprolyl isomerase
MNKYLAPLLIVAVLLAAGCGGSGPHRVQVGDTVRVDYTGTFADGTEFDSSFGREPLEFTVGDGSMIRGFDQAVIGMAAGETKHVVIPPEDAYPYQEDLVVVFNRSDLQMGIEPEVGQQVILGQGDQQYQATVTDFTESTVTLDLNPPVAGKELTFDIVLVEIVTPTPTPTPEIAPTPTATPEP